MLCQKDIGIEYLAVIKDSLSRRKRSFNKEVNISL